MSGSRGGLGGPVSSGLQEVAYRELDDVADGVGGSAAHDGPGPFGQAGGQRRAAGVGQPGQGAGEPGWVHLETGRDPR